MHRRTLLDNGIRVVTEYIPHVRSVTVGFWYRAGSRDEVPEKNGISHLIEHLMFKGTKSRSAREIAEVIDDSGGQMNAYTSKEHTCYYARVLDTHAGFAIDILADMLLHSVFDPAEIEKEKGVVLEEIKMYEDSPDELVHDLFAMTVLGDHPLARPVLGQSHTVKGISRDDVLAYLQQKYHGGNLVIAAAGNLEHDEIVQRVWDAFRDVPGSPTSMEHFPLNAAPGHVIYPKETEQVHVCVGTHAFARNHPDRYALHVLDVALGGGMSSRFFQELREERGLVYSTYTYHISFYETGLFTIYAGTSPENAEQVLELVSLGLQSVVKQGFKDEEISRAKEQLKGGLMLGLEHSANRMSRIARAELFAEDLLTPDELVARIDSVSGDDLVRVTEEIFNGNLWLAAVGPVDDSIAQGMVYA